MGVARLCGPTLIYCSALTLLLPGDYAMAISTQQLEIAFVGRPVLKPPRPCVLAVLGNHLGGGIEMVNRQDPNVGNTAMRATPSKRLNKGQLAFPIAAQMVSCAVNVPVFLAALGRTKLETGWLSALLAATIPRPSAVKVAFLRTMLDAVLAGRPIKCFPANWAFPRTTIPQRAWPELAAKIGRPLGTASTRSTAIHLFLAATERLLAFWTNVFHNSIIVHRPNQVKGYFQIAVKRIQDELDARNSTGPLMRAQERLI